MTLLEEAEHDYSVYVRRLERAIANGVTGQALTLLKRQTYYKRRLVTRLKRHEIKK